MKISQHMRFWYLIHFKEFKAKMSMHKYADSPEHSLLVYTKYKCRMMRTQIKIYISCPVWYISMGETKISCVDPIVKTVVRP